jgi:hypothetical protein
LNSQLYASLVLDLIRIDRGAPSRAIGGDGFARVLSSEGVRVVHERAWVRQRLEQVRGIRQPDSSRIRLRQIDKGNAARAQRVQGAGERIGRPVRWKT